MTIKGGLHSRIWMDDNSGTCRNLSGDVNSITFNRTRTAPEATTMGACTIKRVAGIRDATVDVTSVFDTDVSASHVGGLMDSIWEASLMRRVQLLTIGSAASLPIYTGCFLLTAYSQNVPVDGVVTINYSLALASGSITAACVS